MDTEKEARFIFVRDNEKTVTGITTYEVAKAIAAELGEDTETQRVRVRMRSRTGLWDVVVKTRREAP